MYVNLICVCMCLRLYVEYVYICARVYTHALCSCTLTKSYKYLIKNCHIKHNRESTIIITKKSELCTKKITYM